MDHQLALQIQRFSLLHRDRGRAESFGSIAEQYERYRPSFPEALLDELASLGGEALDVGCGTGKVARGLTLRGLRVLGVELDPRMAAVAVEHGVRVEVARFEEWDDAGRRFDLVTSGDGWHWIEPTGGAAKVARVLRTGGALVRFWNVQVLDPPVLRALEPAYREHAPEVYLYGQAPPRVSSPEPFRLVGPFSAPEMRTYHWERRVSGEDWAAFLGTISDHQRLPAERLALLQARVRSILEGQGDAVSVHGVTTAFLTRREDL